MPRLKTIRISGNKYDGFKKRHRDSVYDLAPEGEGDHSLFTLQNGSGKGVMLQLISQILLPGTAWGKNKGNKLEGMFYNRYNVFKPYTFHVGLEWNLDSGQDKNLLAAICVSARWKEGVDEDDGEVGLKYFLYTHEYSGESRYSLKNLPLYDRTEDKPLPYEELKSFLQEHKYYFRTFSKSSVRSLNSDYYQYLASHGIYRSEWDIMRTINRSEGGLEKYFSRARDNQELFDKLIIPAVSESINNRDEAGDKSLLNIFVENIKIARNLPELISRSDDIKRLNNMVEPLIIDAEHGIKLEKGKKSIWSRGNNLYRTLEDRKNFLANEIKSCKNDREKTEKKIKKLEFQKDNLKYARKIRELQEYKDKKSELTEKHKKLSEKIIDLEAEKKVLRLNKVYLPYQENKKEYQRIKKRITDLQDRLGLAEIKEEIAEVKKKLKKSWPDLKEQWERTTGEYSAYRKYLEEKYGQFIQREKELKDNIRNLQRKIDRFQDREKRLNGWQEELGERFNYLQLSSPGYIREELEEKIEKENRKLEELKDRKEKKDKKIIETREKINGLNLKLAQANNDYQNLEEEYAKRKSGEKLLFGQLKNILDLDESRGPYIFAEVYSKSWLTEKRMELKKLISEKLNKQKTLENEVRELKIDLSLNENDYWIANYDQKRLYEKINNLDVNVFYGSDFLLNIADDREKLLKNYPFLPHSLVLMYKGDWQKVKRNLTEEEIFRSPVPIFINHERKEGADEDSYFELVHGRELEFIEEPAKFREWYDNLNEKKSEINTTIESLANKIKSMQKLDFQAAQLMEEKSSAELELALEEQSEKIEVLKGKIKEAEQNKERIELEYQEITSALENSEKKLAALREDLEEISSFAEEKNNIEDKREEIEEIEELLATYEGKLEENDDKQRQNRDLRIKSENKYEGWKREQKIFFGELKEIIPEAEFIEDQSASPQNNPPDFFDYRDSKTNYYYQQLKDLQKEEEDKNNEIKYLRKDLNRLREEILNMEQEMEEIDPDWSSYEFEINSPEEVKVRLNSLKKELGKYRSQASDINDEINILSGNIETTRKNIEELYQELKDEYNKTPRSLEDVDLNNREYKIESSLKENRTYLTKLKEMIDENRDKKSQVEGLIFKLESQKLNPDQGEINDLIKDKIRENPREVVDKWFCNYREIKDKLSNLRDKVERDFSEFKVNVRERVENEILKSSIKEKIIDEFVVDNYNYNYEVLNSFREYLNNELNKMEDDKREAQQARKQWAERSAMHVIRLVKSLKEMISNMVYHNQKGHAFPLVRLKRDDFLPEEEGDIIPGLEEYFLEVVEEFNKEEIDVSRLSESELVEYTGDAALFSRAIRGKYPKLQVYKMTEKNEFLYARPKDYYYSDWESVIKGKGESPEGSGGQSLSINAFMMMMLLNYRKQSLARSNPWTVMFLDNPFGKASAAHVLDPVFEIADKLNFQIVAFAAPEIVKTEISRRFPVFWALEISEAEKNRGVVTGEVIHGERIRKNK